MALTALLIVAGIVALVIADALAGKFGARWRFAAPGRDIYVIAHRGASRHAPENTLAAFGLGREHGDAIECDVIFTADGVPVVSHHHDLSERVAPEQRPAVIGRMALADVKRLDVRRLVLAGLRRGARADPGRGAGVLRTALPSGLPARQARHDDLPEPSPERVAAIAGVIRFGAGRPRVRDGPLG